VRDLATDPDDAAIVRAIIQMAHSLNLRTIAEASRRWRLLQQLRSFQCDEAQGYLFARPMSALDMERYSLRRDRSKSTQPLAATTCSRFSSVIWLLWRRRQSRP